MEEILDQTGPWHYPVLLLNAIGGFPYPWRVMSLQFMAPKDLNYWCARPNDSISLDDWRVANDGVDLRCFVKKDDDITNGTAVRCNSWEYDHSYYTRTLTEDWDAVCDRRWLVDSSQSFFMSGMLSTLVFSHISDWYGRCTALRISLVLSLVTGFAAASASNFWAFSVLRMANNAVGVGFFTLAVESIGTSKRAMVSLSSEFGWFIGLIVYPVVVYYIRDWRVLQIVSAVPDVFLLLSTLFLDESPKWLVSMGRFDKAKTLLSKIVQRNKLRNVDIAAIVKAAREKIAAENKIRGSVFDLFRGFILARTTLACTLNYMTVVFIYYQMMYYTVKLGTDPYFNLIFIALSEAPISLTSFFVVKYVRRTPMYTITYIATITSLVALLFTTDSAVGLRMTLASISKLSAQVTWSVLYVHMTEIYPTHVRATVSGVVYTASWVSAVTAPLLQTLGEATFTWLPITITISFSLVSWASSFVLPETFGLRLPDTFQESTALLLRRWRRSSRSGNITEPADTSMIPEQEKLPGHIRRLNTASDLPTSIVHSPKHNSTIFPVKQ